MLIPPELSYLLLSIGFIAIVVSCAPKKVLPKQVLQIEHNRVSETSRDHEIWKVDYGKTESLEFTYLDDGQIKTSPTSVYPGE